MNEQIWWYLARSSGLVAWVLLVGSLVLGALLATRALKPLDRPAWLLAMHRWTSGLAVVSTVVHLAALVADSYVEFTLVDLAVPFASTWKTEAVAVGVVATYLLVAVMVTSWMMSRLPKGVWRGVHLTSYAMVWLVTVHAGMAGTDASKRVYQAVALMLTIAAVTAAILRIVIGRRGAAAARAASGLSSGLDPASPVPPPPTAEERVAALAAARAARRADQAKDPTDHRT